MTFYIREFPDQTAALINLQGQQLLSFNNLESALIASRELAPFREHQIIPCIHSDAKNKQSWFD